MHLSQILTQTEKMSPHKEAIICGDKRFDYSQFLTRTMRFANALKGMGVDEGDRVAIIHKNCHTFLESYFAAAYLGAVLVPINFRLSPTEFEYILKDSDAKVVISHPEFADGVLQILDDVPLVSTIIWTEEGEGLLCGKGHFLYEEMLDKAGTIEQPLSVISKEPMAQIYYTSGTTGKPKGVVLTHDNNYTHALWSIEELELTKRDRWLHVSPMFHLADAWAVWAMTKVGGTHVIAPDFHPRKVLESIQENEVTLSNFIPTMLNMLTNEPDVLGYDYTSLRLVMSGGAPIAPEVVAKVLDIFKCEYIQTYGMTETSPFLTMSILEPHLRELPLQERFKYITSTGKTFAKVELKVVDEHLKEVDRNGKEVGEIIVKGPTITSQYWKLPKESEKRIVDGWLHTGDLATMDEEGYVTIVDRKEDMINTGGEMVSSIEVENVLYSHPDILEAAVVGLPDSTWGERIVAAIVLKSERRVEEGDIITFCRDKLARFKTPKNIIFLDRLPKTGSSKISKHVVKKMLSGRVEENAM